MASRGSTELGYTEMKGSWFIFDAYRAHEDWCRWRAPFWHGSRVMDAAQPRELPPRLSLLQDDRTDSSGRAVSASMVIAAPAAPTAARPSTL